MTPATQHSARLVSLLLCMTCLLWSCENRYAEEDQPDASEGGDASKIPASPSENKSGASEGGDALEIPASPSGDQPDASEGGNASKIPASPSGDQPGPSDSGDALEIPASPSGDQPGASDSGDTLEIPASPSGDQPDASDSGDASKIPASSSENKSGASEGGDASKIPDPNPVTSPTPSPSHEDALKHLKAMLTDEFIKKLQGDKLKEALRQLRDDEVGINDTILLGEDLETTILHLVAYSKGDVELVKALIAAGADIHKLDSRSNIPLHLAARKGHRKAVNIILSKMDKNDSEVNTKNKKNQTPLDEANFRLNACEGSNEELSTAKEIIQLLKENGAKKAAEIP